MTLHFYQNILIHTFKLKTKKKKLNESVTVEYKLEQ